MKIGCLHEFAHEAAAFDFRDYEIPSFSEYTNDGIGTTNSLNRRINAALRKAKISSPLDAEQLAGLSAEDKWHALVMDQAFSRAKTTDYFRAFRGVNKRYLPNFDESPVYRDKAFLSASTECIVADSFARANKDNADQCILVIDVPPGIPAISLKEISRKKRESEILFACNTKMVWIETKVLGGRIFHYMRIEMEAES